jgi:hypothetical protein
MNKNDAREALGDFLAKAIDALPINDIAAIPRDDAEAMTDAAGEIDEMLCASLRDAFRDNIPDFRY